MGANFLWRNALCLLAQKAVTRRVSWSLGPAVGISDGESLAHASGYQGITLWQSGKKALPPKHTSVGTGHRKQTAGRMRSKAILEDPSPEFGQQLLQQRDDIERFFGNLTNWGGGLHGLPPWARTHRRVHRWVQANSLSTP